MWCGSVRGSLFLVFAAIWGAVLSQTPHRRFEYKYSFKAPYLAQKDNQVPFWTYSGNAIASSESMRITPSLRSQKGQAWSKLTTTFDWWEVEIVFRINGRGRVGADGLAFWYSTTQGVEGPVFGSSDKWDGLGLFFDSFDNDNKRNNPYVMAMVNDGTKAYDHENDGMSQLLGGCLRDYRNKPHPVRAKIEYFKNTLTVSLQNSNLDILGHPDDDTSNSPPLYNLFHHDSSSMGNHQGGEGGFLLNHFQSSRNGSNDGPEGSERNEGHSDPHTSSSFFGSWFADAQELSGAGEAGQNYPAGPSAIYDEMSGDGTNALYNDSREVGYEDGESRAFSDPSMYDGEAMEAVREEPPSSWYGDPAVNGAFTTSSSLLEIDESAKERWSGSLSSGDEVSAAGGVEGGDAAVNVTEKLKRVKMMRKEKRRLRKERRKDARKFRKIGQRKSRILIHNGLTPSDKDYEICTRAENVVLPRNGYFGLSAATGGLADDHDVLKFLVTSLRSADELTTLENNREQEEQFQREFVAYQEKTQKAREEYVAAHPDATPRHGEDDDDFEGGETRELRQIFQGQSQIYDVIRQLNAKMDEIIGRQERTLSLVGAVHSGLAASGGVPMPPAGVSGSAGAPPLPAVGVISRYEVDSIIGTQRDIAQTAKDVKTVVLDINQKASQILGKPVGSAQPVGGSYDMHVTLKELNEGLNSIKNTLGIQQQQRSGGPAVTDTCPSCLSTWLFVGVAVTQLVVILGYMMFRDNKEAQAKKFY